jgi:hypothetical protein
LPAAETEDARKRSATPKASNCRNMSDCPGPGAAVPRLSPWSGVELLE